MYHAGVPRPGPSATVSYGFAALGFHEGICKTEGMKDADQSSPMPRKASRASAIVWGALCAVLTVLVFYIVYSLASGPRLSEVSRARFDRAREQWKTKGPRSYDIETAVAGLQKAVYRVEVRDGKVVSAVRNGSPLKDTRTMGTWSVPGMFDTMEVDVDHSEEPIRISARESHYVSPLARFDPTYGYPSHYRRIEWGSDVEASWEVTEFRVVD